jgi:threonine/homoserine/homoserine lactone efflux protein
LVAGHEARSTVAGSYMNRFNSWARGWLWSWAVILAVTLVLAWRLGDWRSSYHIVQSILIAAGGAYFVWLIIAGWHAWRRGRSGGASRE